MIVVDGGRRRDGGTGRAVARSEFGCNTTWRHDISWAGGYGAREVPWYPLSTCLRHPGSWDLAQPSLLRPLTPLLHKLHPQTGTDISCTRSNIAALFSKGLQKCWSHFIFLNNWTHWRKFQNLRKLCILNSSLILALVTKFVKNKKFILWMAYQI